MQYRSGDQKHADMAKCFGDAARAGRHPVDKDPDSEHLPLGSVSDYAEPHNKSESDHGKLVGGLKRSLQNRSCKDLGAYDDEDDAEQGRRQRGPEETQHFLKQEAHFPMERRRHYLAPALVRHSPVAAARMSS